METSTISSFFFVWLLIITGFSESVGSWNNSCVETETRCGNHHVRFPFRLIRRQPKPCGYPGFDLQCSSTNHPVLELPRSVKLNVKHIDYRSQTIQLYDPSGCLSWHLPNLTLPSSPFHIEASYLDDDFNVFNCSGPKSSEDVKLISTCLSSSIYHVYAISSGASIGKIPLLSCSKVFNVSSVPSKVFRADYTLHLK
ncbi:putative RING-H2 finger protein ATL21A [Prosopis cineraria]|uniref:putative RING-H2 finger protein ATL21A n=1 Tax=Prosopis cineraria TaxID=364024 RepID=UPI00240F7A36|nr:putative RING-H2 finger protein ATL21A [Prosopis cineraria]